MMERSHLGWFLAKDRRRHRRTINAIASWFIVGVITIGLAEVALRLAFPVRLARPLESIAGEQRLMRHDGELGWSYEPGASSTFTNGLVSGRVHIDAIGIRQNGATSTFDEALPVVFMIGDSNTAQLEVDDEKTVSTLLETRWRGRGLQANLLNLGVRGYGTDQAVLRALSLRRLNPRSIIYTFTNNDLGDNNALHKPQRGFGKGAFIRRRGQVAFSAYNYPVPNYTAEQMALVVMDSSCDPVLHERIVSVNELQRGSYSLTAWLRGHSWTVRAVRSFRTRPWWEQPSWDPADLPLGRYPGWEWMDDIYKGFYEKGALRNRCLDYLEAQMLHLLRLLRQIPTLESVFVVHYPDAQALPDLKAGHVLPTVQMFRRFRENGVIDGYLNLGQRLVEAGIKYEDFTCAGDGWHVCDKATPWMARQIDEAFAGQLFVH